MATRQSFASLVRVEMTRRSDPHRAKAMGAYMKNVKEFRGIASPAVVEIVNAAEKDALEEWKEFGEVEAAMRELWEGRYREEQHAALRLGRKHIR